MLKWVGRILYFVFLMIITPFVTQYAVYSKSQAFYEKEVANHLKTDINEYLNGLQTIINTHYIATTDGFIYEYQNTDPQSDYQISLALVPTRAQTSSSVVYDDGFFILLTDINVYQTNAETNERELVEDLIIRISYTMYRETSFPEGDNVSGDNNNYYTHSYVYRPSLGNTLGNVPFVYVFDSAFYDSENKTHAQIDSIRISFSSGATDADGKAIYHDLFMALNGSYDGEIKGNNLDTSFVINPDEYRLTQFFTDNEPSEGDLLQYNLSATRYKDKLNSYNYLVWRAMIFYVLGIMVLTYFIFFHKKVMEAYRQKKYAKKQEERKNLPVKEAIFKDTEEIKDER